MITLCVTLYACYIFIKMDNVNKVIFGIVGSVIWLIGVLF